MSHAHETDSHRRRNGSRLYPSLEWHGQIPHPIPAPIATGSVPGASHKKAGPVLASLGVGTGDPTPPGSLFKESAKVSGMNTPDAYGALIDVLGQSLNPTASFGPTPPGLSVKSLTPGCSQGTTGGGHKICF
jgi:hypothetical protein